MWTISGWQWGVNTPNGGKLVTGYKSRVTGYQIYNRLRILPGPFSGAKKRGYWLRHCRNRLQILFFYFFIGLFSNRLHIHAYICNRLPELPLVIFLCVTGYTSW